MRLAHLILVHNNPKQLERLISRLMHRDADIYIHLDKKADLTQFLHLKSWGNIFFIVKRVTITWANYSMVRATLNSFEEILASGNRYSHINLLSGADYPLKNAATIHKFLFENANKTFMKYRHIHKEWPESTSRFALYSFGDYNFPLKFFLQFLFNKLLPARKLPNNLQPYGRSQWFSITPVCAKYVMGYLAKNAPVKRFFRMTWGVDELIFQTILLNSCHKNSIVNNHLRYIRFTPGASNPHTLTIKDKEILAGCDQFYARKFNPETDSEILDYLDRIAENVYSS